MVTQSPAAGERIKPGAIVRLEVEVEPTTAPNVVGSTLDSARRVLKNAELEVGRIEVQLEVGADSGIVRSQSVAAKGEVAPGTTIDLVVSETGASVPRLNGRTRSQAENDLRNADLELGRVTMRASRAKVNTVVDQSPDAGKTVKANSDVDIVLADQCTVPNIMGLSEDAAIVRVTDGDFSWRTYPMPSANTDLETVHAQSPKANTKHDCGSRVDIGLGYWTVQ